MNQKSSLREDPQFVSWVLTGNTLIQAENLLDSAGGMLHVILPISIVVVSAALATAGTIEIANVRIINLHLIMVSLQLDWNC